MSKKRYRSRPGQPRTETEAMIRAMAIEILDGALDELNQEISILSETVELYRHELRKRRQDPDKEWGRWQVAPGVAMRAQSALRRLRDRRDKMLAETEAEVVEIAMAAPDVPEGEHTEPKPGEEKPETRRPQQDEPEFDWHAAAKAIVKRGSSVTNPGGLTPDKRKREPVPA